MNELTSFTSTTRKGYQTVSNASNCTVRNGLHRLHIRGTMYPEHRKERRSNDCYGRIPDTRRNCKGPQEVRGHYHAVASARQNTRIQSRRYLGCEQERLRQLAGQPEQLNQARGQGQKIKPACGWPATIKNLVAFRSSARLWKAKLMTQGTRYPFSSIALTFKCCQVLYELWVCDRKEVYP